jgi:hypothetical protein
MRDDDKDDAPRPPDFGPGIPVHKLNSDDNEHGAIVRRDGLEVIFSTSRPGGKGDMDLWTATRKSTFHKWSKPEHIEGLINSEFFEGGRMTLSFDGRELYFRRGRTGDPGNGDLWVARRKKLGDPD